MTILTRRNALLLATSVAIMPLTTNVVNAASHASAHTITIKDFVFEPANLAIKAGDTVTFVNADSAPHTATADNGSFDTGRLGNGQSAALTFASAGSYSYFCAVHPRMKGTITVN